MGKMIGIYLILINFLSFYAHAEPDILQSIDNKDLPAIEKFLASHDINGIYGSSKITLLAYAILAQQVTVIDLLLDKGADPNQFVKGISPLMYAVQSEKRLIVKRLIEHGSAVNALDSVRNTPLMYAAQYGDVKMIKILLKNGAFLNFTNQTWLSAYDFAVRSNNLEVARYLNARYEKNLPNFHDGPYVTWEKNNVIKAFYLIHDSTRNKSIKINRSFNANDHSFLMKGFAGDDNNYQLRKNDSLPCHDFSDVSKLLILGDIHGGYDSLVFLLQHNKIINSDYDWIWGDGQLLFLGDIFDRGDKVTEALWLIYQLENQARKVGGYVHYLLGNHEVMILLKDHRFLTKKYYYLTQKLKLNYGHLYNKKTILGQWLRTKNTMVKINDMLFVHAGISPEVASLALSIEEMNKMVRYFLTYPERNRKYGIPNRELLLGMAGPFWYRGFIEPANYYRAFTEKDLDGILKAYQVSKIFIGHTNVDNISSLYNGQIIMMDVPFYTYGFNMQAIIVENGEMFLINSLGSKTRFNTLSSNPSLR